MLADTKRWYTVQTRSNMENKVVDALKHLIDVEDMGAYIDKDDILMPTETVSEIKNGKKTVRQRKLYPGYVFIKIKLYDEAENFLEKPWYFVKAVNGVINFMGGEKPTPLKKKEIDDLFFQIENSKGVEKPKVNFSVGETVKITEGSFLNLVGVIDEIDPERGKLKVSVSIFGRFTPVELEYSSVVRAEDE